MKKYLVQTLNGKIIEFNDFEKAFDYLIKHKGSILIEK